VAKSDVIVTMPTQLVETYKKPFELRSYDPPVPIRPFTLSAGWHRNAPGRLRALDPDGP